jgi:hypothetical protein
VDLPASAPAGSVVTVTVTFTNSASGGTATTASATVGTVTLSNGQVQTYTLGNLAPGASVTQHLRDHGAGHRTVVLEATSTVATGHAREQQRQQQRRGQPAGEQLTPLFSDPGVKVNPIPSGTPGQRR